MDDMSRVGYLKGFQILNSGETAKVELVDEIIRIGGETPYMWSTMLGESLSRGLYPF